jgi:hypothetical protein
MLPFNLLFNNPPDHAIIFPVGKYLYTWSPPPTFYSLHKPFRQCLAWNNGFCTVLVLFSNNLCCQGCCIHLLGRWSMYINHIIVTLLKHAIRLCLATQLVMICKHLKLILSHITTGSCVTACPIALLSPHRLFCILCIVLLVKYTWNITFWEQLLHIAVWLHSMASPFWMSSSNVFMGNILWL